MSNSQVNKEKEKKKKRTYSTKQRLNDKIVPKVTCAQVPCSRWTPPTLFWIKVAQSIIRSIIIFCKNQAVSTHLLSWSFLARPSVFPQANNLLTGHDWSFSNDDPFARCLEASKRGDGVETIGWRSICPWSTRRIFDVSLGQRWQSAYAPTPPDLFACQNSTPLLSTMNGQYPPPPPLLPIHRPSSSSLPRHPPS